MRICTIYFMNKIFRVFSSETFFKKQSIEYVLVPTGSPKVPTNP